MNTWRLSRETYDEMKKNILSKHETVDDWAKLSLNSVSEMSDEERMCRLMMNNDLRLKGESYICIAYMCDTHKMSEEFLKDAIYVNSGLCLLGCWNEEVIDWVLDIYCKRIDPKLSASEGNALEDVKEAVENERFIKKCPEYHKYLTGLLSNYNTLLANLEASKEAILNIEAGDIEELCKEVLKASTYATDISNYWIIVRNRLDWETLRKGLLYKYDKDFLSIYERRTTNKSLEELSTSFPKNVKRKSTSRPKRCANGYRGKRKVEN